MKDIASPIYDPLAAIRQVIVQSLGEIKSSKLITEWKRFIEHLIELAFDVSEVASPIFNSIHLEHATELSWELNRWKSI